MSVAGKVAEPAAAAAAAEAEAVVERVYDPVSYLRGPKPCQHAKGEEKGAAGS